MRRPPLPGDMLVMSVGETITDDTRTKLEREGWIHHGGGFWSKIADAQTIETPFPALILVPYCLPRS